MQIPMHSVVLERYVSGSPGSLMTLKIEMFFPTNPDWYTFHPE